MPRVSGTAGLGAALNDAMKAIADANPDLAGVLSRVTSDLGEVEG